MNYRFWFLSYTIIWSCRPVKYSYTFFHLFLYACIYIFLPIGKYVKRGEPIFPSVYIGNALMLLLLFQRATGIKKKTFSSIVIGLVYRQKGGYTSCYENDRKFLIISYRDFIAAYLPTPFTIH